MSVWHNASTLRLVQLLKTKESLWNVAHPDYSNRRKRDDDLRLIVRDLRISTPECTVKQVREKIDYIKTQMRREIRKIEDSKRRGFIRIYRPKLYWFKAASFLKPHYTKNYSKASSMPKTDPPASSDCESHLIPKEEQNDASHKEIKNEKNNESVTSRFSDNYNLIIIPDDESFDEAHIPKTATTTITRSSMSIEENDDVHMPLNWTKPCGEPNWKPEEVTESVSNTNAKESDVFGLFGKNVTAQLEQLPLEEAYSSMVEIQNVLTTRKINSLRKA